ncbi:MAG: carboxypeptidase-like regulatory domain-containing protein [Candidatus Paceibacterota bacterium]
MLEKKSRSKLILFRFFIVVLLLFFGTKLVFASETNGIIDGNYKYAWGENIGWINFGCDNCNVNVTDDGLSGYAWSTQYGWINLDPTTSGVQNNGQGLLSGYAWSPNLGWINFNGVTISSNGYFLGYATIESDSSQINFNCTNADSCSGADFKVKTDWKPASARQSGGSGAGGSGFPVPPNPPPVVPPTIPPVVPPTIVNVVVDNISETINSISDSFFNLFQPQNKPENTIVEIPKIAPLSLKVLWNLLPRKAIKEFVFAPLPYEVRVLASKFPELDRTLKSVGIKRLTDMSKLSGVTLNLPGLTELTNTLRNVGAERLAGVDKLNSVNFDIPGLSNLDEKMVNNIGVNIGTGKISLIKGLPLTKFSLLEKKNLPSEFVFARTNGELIDLNVAMSVSEKGEVTQKISSLPGKTLRFVVKPISKARSVTGYFIFKSATPKITQNQIPRSSLTASALFSMSGLVEKTSKSVPVENKLVLSSFEYTDLDHDGIYTADVVSPSVPGEYEVITVIDYLDPVLGARQMRMITVIDPEGYVFEKNNGKETRIPSAIISLYSLNNLTKKYELWVAKDYQQENPQITDVRGTYSFLVPEGSYYFQIEAPGYDFYQGKAFVVVEGSGIHQNIELKSSRGWFSVFDWKTVLLIVVLLLLVYNLYRNTLRDKLLKFSNK